MDGGKISYSEVRTFLTKDSSGINMFKSITTSMNRTITLTGNHLIYTCCDIGQRHYSPE